MKNDINEKILQSVMEQAKIPDLKGNDAQEITGAYSDMFSALTYMYLLQGNTLGQSWYNAIKQMESFIRSKDKFNAVTNHLTQILNTHRKDLSKQMMTDENRDKIIMVTPEKREQMKVELNEKLKSAMEKINRQVEKYREQAEELKKEIAKEAEKRAHKLADDIEKAKKEKAKAKKKENAQNIQKPAVNEPISEKNDTINPNSARPPRLNNNGPVNALNGPMITTPVRYEQHQGPVAVQSSPVTPTSETHESNNALQMPKQQQTTAQKLHNAKQCMQLLAAQRQQMQQFIQMYNQHQNQHVA